MKDLKVYYPYPYEAGGQAVTLLAGFVRAGELLPCVGMVLGPGQRQAPLFTPADAILDLIADGFFATFHPGLVMATPRVFACFVMKHRDDPQLASRFYGAMTVPLEASEKAPVRAGERFSRLIADDRLKYQILLPNGAMAEVDAVWMMTRQRPEPSPYVSATTLSDPMSTEAARLWASEEANPPIFVKGPRLPEALAAELRAVEGKTALERFEYASAWKPDGTVIYKHHTSYEEGQVRLLPDGFDEDALLGAVLTHNHPGGSPFSLADIRAAAAFDMAEMRAVSKEGERVYVYRALRPKDGWPWPGDIKRPELSGSDKVLRLIAEEKLSFQVAKSFWYGMGVVALAKRYGIGLYKEVLR